MSKRKLRGADLTAKKLLEKGFVENPDGSWSKRQADRPCGDPRPQGAKLERDAEEKCEGKAGPEKVRKTENTTGLRYQLVVLSFRSRPIDPSNGCCKYIEDAFTEAGLIPDDSVWFVDSAPIFLQILVPENEQRTEVFLFEINEQHHGSQEKHRPQKENG